MAIRLEVVVGGDFESVVRWWCDPARLQDRRTELESGPVSDFSWQESYQDGVLTAIAEWTRKDGRQIRLKTSAPRLPDGIIEREPSGCFVLPVQVNRRVRLLGGRELEADGEQIKQVSGDPPRTNRPRLHVHVSQRRYERDREVRRGIGRAFHSGPTSLEASSSDGLPL